MAEITYAPPVTDIDARRSRALTAGIVSLSGRSSENIADVVQTIHERLTALSRAHDLTMIDLGADGCTMFYTSFGPNVKRFDVCGNVQLPNFNVAPLPGGMGQDLRVLPDGGVLVSSGQVIVRLNSHGSVVQTYRGPSEDTLWSGLDLAEDGTFWVGNYRSSNVYKLNLTTGAIVQSFNAGSPPNTVVGIRIMK